MFATERQQPACFSGRGAPAAWPAPAERVMALALRHARAAARPEPSRRGGRGGRGPARAVGTRLKRRRGRLEGDAPGPASEAEPPGFLSVSTALDDLPGASTFDIAAQVLQSPSVEDGEVVALSLGMCKTVRAAQPALRQELQGHDVIPLLERTIDARFQSLPDEAVVLMLCALEGMEAQGCQVSRTQQLARELSGRLQDRQLHVSADQATWLLDVFCRSGELRSHAADVALPVAQGLQLEGLAPQQLHTVVRCLLLTGQARGAARTVQAACQRLAPGLGELSAPQLYQLCLLLDSLAPYMLPRAAQAAVDALLAADPGLAGPWQLPQLLGACSRAPLLDLQPLKEAAAGALARQAPAEAPKYVQASLWALGRLRPRLSPAARQRLQAALDPTLFAEAAGDAAPLPRDAVDTLVALDRLRLQPPGGYLERVCDSICTRALSHETRLGGGVTLRDVASFVRCLAACGHRTQDLQRFFELILRALPEAGPADLAHLAGGMAQLHCGPLPLPPPLWRELDAAAAPLLPRFDLKSLAMLLHAYGRARVRPEATLPPALAICCACAGELRMRDAADVLWALAMLRARGAAELEAAARLAAQCERLLGSQARLAVRDLAAAAWAVASLDGLPHEPRARLLTALARVARPSNAMNAFDVSQVLWAAGKLGVVPPFLPRYTERIEQLALSLQPVHVTSILWAYARFGKHPGIELTEALLSGVVTGVHQFDPQGVGNALWACAKLRHHPGALLAAVRADLGRRGAEYSAADWSAVVYGFAQLGEDPGELLQLLHHLVEERRVAADAHLAATVVWAAAVFGRLREPAARAMAAQLQGLSAEDMAPDSLACVRQAALLACLSQQWGARDVPPGLRPAGEPGSWLAGLLGEDQSAEANRQYRLIGAALHALRLPQAHAYQLGSADRAGRVFRLSLVLKRPWGTPRTVAVELLTPRRLTVNTHQPLARALLRRACLRACGLDVLLLPYSEWHAARAKGVAEEYLAGKLHALLNGPPEQHA